MRCHSLHLFLLFACLLSAYGAEVYVNGVKAEGLTDTEFKGCTVKFDNKGIVHITAPGVKLLAEGEGTDTNKLSEQYFVALTLTQGATVPIKIIVNGVEADTLKPGEKTKIVEVSKFLRKGGNKLLVMATPEKNPLTVQVLVGPGKMNAGNVELAPTADRQTVLGDKGISETFDLTAK